MTKKERIIILCAIFFFQFLYFPINRIITGGVKSITPWDEFIPLWPIWTFPYLLSLLWWGISIIWATLKMDAKLFRAFGVAMIASLLTSYAVFIIFPTYVERPPLESGDWTTRLLALVYNNDQVNNAFPSGHTYTSVIIALFWWRWFHRFGWLWFGMVAVVVLSTLFTKQHYLLDPIGGILWGWFAYRFGLWVSEIWSMRRDHEMVS
jgi:membrane-associated phospholipid phosphatase